MARIRSVKPEFWTDEALSECSPTARLLFIGTWTFADDKGNLERSSKQLKAQVFPYDMIDCEPLVLDLIAHGVLIEYESDGKKYLHIKGFSKHQKIDKESKARFPERELSVSGSGVVAEDSPSPRTGGEGRGEEGKGAIKAEDLLSAIAESAAADLQCPHLEIINAYHEAFPVGPKVRASRWAGSQSEKNLRIRWREGLASSDGWFRYKTREEGLRVWREFFEVCAGSDFLSGRVSGKDNQPPFLADIHWLLIRANFDKVLSNKYHRKEAA